MLSNLFLAPTRATINRFRGAGGLRFTAIPGDYVTGFYAIPGCRILNAVLWGIFSAVQLKSGYPLWLGLDFLFGTLLFYLFSVFGWAQYFSAFTGIWKPTEGHVGWITNLGRRLVRFDIDFDSLAPTPATLARNRLRGWICMTLRMGYIIPWFLYIGWRTHHLALAAVLGVVAAITSGIIYRYSKIIANWFGGMRDAIEAAEWLTGFSFGIFSIYLQ